MELFRFRDFRVCLFKLMIDRGVDDVKWCMVMFQLCFNSLHSKQFRWKRIHVHINEWYVHEE